MIANLNRFNSREDIKGTTPIKSSIQRGIKAKLVQAYPNLKQVIDELIPKKSQLTQIKWFVLISIRDF